MPEINLKAIRVNVMAHLVTTDLIKNLQDGADIVVCLENIIAASIVSLFPKDTRLDVATIIHEQVTQVIQDYNSKYD